MLREQNYAFLHLWNVSCVWNCAKIYCDEIIQAATETGCLGKAFFCACCIHARKDYASTEKRSISNIN